MNTKGTQEPRFTSSRYQQQQQQSLTPSIPPTLPLAPQSQQSGVGASNAASFGEDIAIQLFEDGRRRFINSKGQQRKIIPRANSFLQLFLGDKIQRAASDPKVGEQIERIKQQYQKRLGVDTNSSIYNYHSPDIYLLGLAYGNEMPVESLKEMQGRYKAIQRKQKFFNHSFLVYVTFALTTFTKRWSKLTTNNYFRFYCLFFCVGSVGVLQIEKMSEANMGILRHSKQWQSVIKLHEKKQQLL